MASKRLTFTPDARTMEELSKLKQKKYFDKPWSEVCLNIIKMGIKEAKKGN